MIIDGENIILSFDETAEEVEELHDFIKPRLEYIESITVEGNNKLSTSLLLQLLASIKRSKPSIKIALLDEDSFNTKSYAQIKWTNNV